MPDNAGFMIAAYVVVGVIVAIYAISLVVRLKGVAGSTRIRRQDAKTPSGS